MPQPNILFILIDDLGARDLACYGSSFYDTPRLDALADEGLRFTDAYASCPVCSPTRASLLSGKYPARVGVTNYIGGHAVGRLCDVPYFWQLPESEYTLAAALRDGGYQTWHVGKWHLGDWPTPEFHGFEVNRAGCGWGHPRHGYFSPWGIPGYPDGPDGQYLTDRLTDDALTLLRARDPQRPFFLHLSHYAVHTPIQAPADLTGRYRAKAAELGLDESEAFVPGAPFPCRHKQHQRIRRRRFQGDAAYAAMIANLDHNLGRVFDVLEEEGLADDTLVVFTSDNGGLATAEGAPTCNAPLAEGKGWMYEGGIRVCQLARWPGVITAGSTCTEPTTSPDWYPTLLAAAGLPQREDQHEDGVDISPLLRGEPHERGPIFWHFPHYGNQGGTPAAAVRDGDWKLIRFFEDKHHELYNLREDLEEQRNLAATEPERTRGLSERLTAWQQEVEALIPKRNPNWVPPELPEGCDPAED